MAQEYTVCASVYLGVCLYVSVYVRVCLWVCMCVYRGCACIYVYVCMCICVCVSECACLCVCISLCLSVFLCVSVSLSLYVFVPTSGEICFASLYLYCLAQLWLRQVSINTCPPQDLRPIDSGTSLKIFRLCLLWMPQ